MTIEVEFHADPAMVMREAGTFLASKPVAHNLILTLLNTRVRYPEPGRYWTVRANDTPVGVVFQSPLDFGCTVTPMPPEAVDAAVRAVSETGVELPGVQGEAATAARFAGQWTEWRKCAAEPIEGQRLYEVREVVAPPWPTGGCRRAELADRLLLENWMDDFAEETGHSGGNAVGIIDRLLPAGQFWLWKDGQPRSAAAHSDPVAGATRIQAVYTPK